MGQQDSSKAQGWVMTNLRFKLKVETQEPSNEMLVTWAKKLQPKATKECLEKLVKLLKDNPEWNETVIKELFKLSAYLKHERTGNVRERTGKYNMVECIFT